MIPETVKAAVVEIREEPSPGEVLLELVASGMWHADLHAADGDWPTKPTRIVVALWSGVTRLKEGDRLGLA
jgi:D-arabinose 1-dehydrogenase-like Zn-dependent alcohol dehydrogenase